MRARTRTPTAPLRDGHDDGRRSGKNSVRRSHEGAVRRHLLAQSATAARAEDGMIIDVNASLGHYAFRALRHNTAATLLELMDRNGIVKAVVSSLPALFYRDAHRG